MAKITKMLMALERFSSPLRPPSTTPIENPAPQDRHKQWQSRSSYQSATAVAVLAVKIATNIFAAATNSLPVQIQKHHLLAVPCCALHYPLHPLQRPLRMLPSGPTVVDHYLPIDQPLDQPIFNPRRQPLGFPKGHCGPHRVGVGGNLRPTQPWFSIGPRFSKAIPQVPKARGPQGPQGRR